MNSIGHLAISIVKSSLRIGSCIWCIASNSIIPLAWGFLIAELLGIAEELVDKR